MRGAPTNRWAIRAGRIAVAALGLVSAPGPAGAFDVLADSEPGLFQGFDHLDGLQKPKVLPYRLYRPADWEAGRWPLVLFLHGIGERGTDNVKQVTVHFPPLAERLTAPNRGAFVVAPQEAYGGYFQPAVLEGLVRALAARYPIDLRRVIITGLSAGGGNTVLAIAHTPRFYCAALPLSGTGVTVNPQVQVLTPTWFLVGANDGMLNSTLAMYAAQTKAGGTPRLTVIPGMGHGNWAQIYADNPLYTGFFQGGDPADADQHGIHAWMLAHRRTDTLLQRDTLAIGESVLLDFGMHYAVQEGPDAAGRFWNSLQLDPTAVAATPAWVASLRTTAGRHCGLLLEVRAGVTGRSNNGLSTAFGPDAATRDGWIAGTAAATWVIHGLCPGGEYRIRAYSSLDDYDAGKGFHGELVAGGRTARFNAKPAAPVFTMGPVVADRTGAIHFSLRADSSQGSQKTCLNALELFPVALPVPSPRIGAGSSRGTVRLAWEPVPGRYEVRQAAHPAGPWQTVLRVALPADPFPEPALPDNGAAFFTVFQVPPGDGE